MKNKKFLLLLVLALITPLLFLTACGDEDGTTAEAPPATEAPDVDENGDDEPADEPLETIYLDFWHAMTGAHEDALMDVIEAFHAEYSHIRIQAEFQGNYTAINESVMAAAVAGLNNLPHLVQQTTDNVTEYINDGIVVSLTEFFNDPEVGLSQAEINDIKDVFREGVIWDGEFMSVPFGKSTRVLFYNIDLFEEHDLEVPTTWEELIEVAQVLTDVDANRFGMGFENGWGAEFIALVIQHGGEYIDEATATAHFAEQPGIDAAQFVIDMIDAGYARFAGEDGFLSGVFGNGFVGMYIGSSAGLPHVTAAVAGDFTWSTAPLPLYNGNAASRFQGNDLVLMNNGASEDEQLAAWQFMAFTMRPEIAAQWAASSGYIPISDAALAHEIWVNHITANPHAAAAAEQFDAGFMTARVPGANPVWHYLVAALNDVRDGEATIEDALTDAQERANAALGN